MLLVYVDGIIITGNKDLATKALKDFFYNHFHIKNLEILKYFLEIKVARSS